MLLSRTNEQSGLWLPTAARIKVIMPTNVEMLNSQALVKDFVHLLYNCPGLRSARDVGLVRDHEQAKSQIAQSVHGLRNIRQNFELLD